MCSSDLFPSHDTRPVNVYEEDDQHHRLKEDDSMPTESRCRNRIDVLNTTHETVDTHVNSPKTASQIISHSVAMFMVKPVNQFKPRQDQVGYQIYYS